MTQAENVNATALVQRLYRRYTEPLGLIDVRHAQAHYARIMRWTIAQRLPLLTKLAARQGGDDGVLAELGDWVYRAAPQVAALETAMAVPSSAVSSRPGDDPSPTTSGHSEATALPAGQFRVRLGGASLRVPSAEGARPAAATTPDAGAADPAGPVAVTGKRLHGHLPPGTGKEPVTQPFVAEAEELVRLPVPPAAAMASGQASAFMQESLARPTATPVHVQWRVNRVSQEGTSAAPFSPAEPADNAPARPRASSATAKNASSQDSPTYASYPPGPAITSHQTRAPQRDPPSARPGATAPLRGTASSTNRTDARSSVRAVLGSPDPMSSTLSWTPAVPYSSPRNVADAPVRGSELMVVAPVHAVVSRTPETIMLWRQLPTLTAEAAARSERTQGDQPVAPPLMRPALSSAPPASTAGGPTVAQTMTPQPQPLRLKSRDWERLAERLTRVIFHKLAVELERRGIRGWR
jgi:hypothetical protein